RTCPTSSVASTPPCSRTYPPSAWRSSATRSSGVPAATTAVPSAVPEKGRLLAPDAETSDTSGVPSQSASNCRAFAVPALTAQPARRVTATAAAAPTGTARFLGVRVRIPRAYETATALGRGGGDPRPRAVVAPGAVGCAAVGCVAVSCATVGCSPDGAASVRCYEDPRRRPRRTRRTTYGRSTAPPAASHCPSAAAHSAAAATAPDVVTVVTDLGSSRCSA